MKEPDRGDTDPRRYWVEYPTTSREEELDHDDDVLSEWRPAFVPVR